MASLFFELSVSVYSVHKDNVSKNNRTLHNESPLNVESFAVQFFKLLTSLVGELPLKFMFTCLSLLFIFIILFHKKREKLSSSVVIVLKNSSVN